MADTDGLSRQQQLQQQFMMNARQQQMQAIKAAQQQREAMRSGNGDDNTPSKPLSHFTTGNGFPYDGIPIMEPNDLDFIGQKPPYFENFEATCRNGPLSTVQSIVSSETRSPSFLHRGLILALSAGNIEIARYLLSAGAPVVRETPNNILSAPSDQQLPLFELLAQHGWTPDTSSSYGADLLPSIVTNIPLLRWLLAHGANPNLGWRRDTPYRAAGLDMNSGAAIESAARSGNIEAVRILLDAGAEIQNGVPLHHAAGACPPGMNPHASRVTPSKEFDVSRIPVMELLVECGADVNKPEESPHMVPRYAVVHAVMAGAVERVRWLLEHGADPEASGAFGSAAAYAKLGSEEMRRVVEEGVKARRWVQNENVTI